MRLVIQRVKTSSVEINQKPFNSIENGFMILLGIEENDGEEDIKWLVNKIKGLRVFPDSKGIMNLSIMDIKGEVLLISQFTLYASTRKGNRPSYLKSAKPEAAIPLYNRFIELLRGEIAPQLVKTGEFGADMKVSLVNDGPVTIIIDSKLRE